MAAYLIGTINVTDPSWLPEYTEKVVKQFAAVGAKYHVRSTEIEALEGVDRPPNAAIIVEFPSMEVAREWYNSDAYQALVELRKKGSTVELLLTEGM